MKGHYVQPETVCYPKSHVGVDSVKVLVDKGTGGFSIATLKWDGNPCIGVRWNGENNSIGWPISRGRPTWFILPDEIGLAYAKQTGGVKMEKEWRVQLHLDIQRKGLFSFKF